jgi:hypothetical protein
MTSIAEGLRIRNRWTYRIFSRFRTLDPSGGEHLLDSGDDSIEQMGFAKDVAAGKAYLLLWVSGSARRDSKRDRHDRLKLVDVRNIIYERQWLSGMDEPDCRRVTRRENRRFGNAV